MAGALPAGADAAAQADQGRQGVISYPASFFAAMGLDTAYDMVQRVPGFAFDDGGAVRGFADAAGNVLIDGDRPASKTDDLVSILRRIPISQVERIDLIRGGAPGIDMQGKTVVANVIRKKDSGFKGVATIAGYKPLNIPFDPQIRLEGNWQEDGRTFEASLFAARYHDASQGGGTHLILAPDGHVEDASKLRGRLVSWQYLITSAYETPAFGGKLKLNLTLEDQPNHKDALDDFEFAGAQAEHDRQDAGDFEFGQHFERRLSDTWKLEMFGLEHLNKTGTISLFDTTSDHQDFVQNNHSGEGIARAILHWRTSPKLNVDMGGEFAYNWLNTQTRFTDNGTPVSIPAGDVFVSEKRGEIFTNTVWQASKTLSIEGDLRTEASTISSTGDVTLTKTLVFPKPRLAATWTPDAEDQLRVRVEREVGQLDFGNFAANAALNSTGVVAGNPNLSPQRDWAFEIAYDRHFWTDGVVSLTLRHLILQDVVDRVPVFAPSGAFDEPGNIGDGSENDIVASFTTPLDRLGIHHATLRGTGTWRFSKITDPTTQTAREISFQHPVDAELHFTQDIPEWNVNWGVDSFFAFPVRDVRFNEIDTTDNGREDTVFLEYKPEPDLTLRVQSDLQQVLTDAKRDVFAGPRNTNPLQFIDIQKHHFGTILFFRLRKTFN
jgi:outer membrane receptor protein involved in Fe transport